MRWRGIRVSGLMCAIARAACITTARADSTSPRLAAYYDLTLLLCDDVVFQWRDDDKPIAILDDVIQVGVGRDAAYALTVSSALITWTGDGENRRTVSNGVSWFAAGRTGVVVAREGGDILYFDRPKSWFGEGDIQHPITLDLDAASASVGDSANYVVAGDGRLFVKGLAHRGQYGDGRLEPTDHFIPVATDVVSVKAHTGHAILLRRDGAVLGTGGNKHGPLGRHGIGDKAITWGAIFEGASAIATGSTHSLALRSDGSLWQWGRNIGLDPVKILDDVEAAAADSDGSIALKNDGTLWQWSRGALPRQHFKCPG